MKMLEEKVADLAMAKAQLAIQVRKIASLEEQIANTFPTKLEGSVSSKIGSYKVTVTTKLSRKLDFDAYQALELPKNLAFVDLKPAINIKRMKAVEMVDPALVAKVITTKPAKTVVKLEVLDES